MKNLVNTTLLAATLIFASGSFVFANAQQLQSDGTMSPASAQQQAATPPQAAPPQAGTPKHAHNPAHEARHLSKQLGLTPDQTSQLQPILADRDSRMTALHADNTLDPRAMHRQGHAIEVDTQGKINALLTPAQQQLYADIRAAHHKGRGAPAGAPSPAPAPTA